MTSDYFAAGSHDMIRVGIIGTGFIAKGALELILHSTDFIISSVLTRRELSSIEPELQCFVTNSLNELIDHSDIVFECSGDAIYATEVINEISKTNIKVVTINSEFHVTAGSYFAKQGMYLTEADGDQPGCLARLKQEVEGMGFSPIAYVNLKGFLNPNPSMEEMKYWSEKQNLALSQVISFTDGTKLQIEQALVANGLGATLAKEGMIGATVNKLEDLDYLVDAAETAGSPVSEYIICPGSPPGVLIVANNEVADRLPGYLPFSRLKTTDNKAYILLRSYHLVYLEVLNTLRKVINNEKILLNNSPEPKITVAAIAKKKLAKDSEIAHGAGGFEVRGKAVKLVEHPDAVPVCLLHKTRLIRNVEPGQEIKFDDVELDDTLALKFYREVNQLNL